MVVTDVFAPGPSKRAAPSPASKSQPSPRTFLSGLQALAHLPILQRQRDLAAGRDTAGFISGYRGSPIGGLDQTLWEDKARLEAHRIKFQPRHGWFRCARSVKSHFVLRYPKPPAWPPIFRSRPCRPTAERASAACRSAAAGTGAIQALAEIAGCGMTRAA